MHNDIRITNERLGEMEVDKRCLTTSYRINNYYRLQMQLQPPHNFFQEVKF